MKTSELIGPALDWAVAKCEGVSVGNAKQEHGFIETVWDSVTKLKHAYEIYNPSTNWSQGGPIIEREKITLEYQPQLEQWLSIFKEHYADVGRYVYGPTPLIAAMRCLIASRLGNKVDIPEELK